VGYFEFDILPIEKNKRNATTAITIKDHGLSRIPTEDCSYWIAQRFGHRPNPHDYTVFKI